MEDVDVYTVLAEQEQDHRPKVVQLIDKYRIKAADEFAEKRYLLERDGVGFSPRGNVCAIAAEKKAGKTWFGMAMCAASTRGEFLGMKAREENLKVLFFDTEQDAGDGQRIQRRIHYANGWDFKTDNERFQIFHLREVSASERREFVKEAIEYLEPDLVVVDGIRDLLKDFNDIEQSVDVIEEHMALSSRMNCCIWDVLHVNPNSEKMRGHLGTELGNKVSDIIHLTKKKNPTNEEDVTYKAEETDARGHRDIKSITFRINDSTVFGMPELVGEEEAEAMSNDAKSFLMGVMKKYVPKPGSISLTKLRDAIKAGEGIGSTKAWNLAQDAIKAGVIKQAINGKYVITDEAIMPEALPFEKPTDDVPY